MLGTIEVVIFFRHSRQLSDRRYAMRQLIAPILLFMLSIAGCGGGSDSKETIPLAATEMSSELKSNMARFMPTVTNIEASLLFVLNSGSPMAEGMTVTPDTSPGAPPNTVTFTGTYDGNDDGLKETTMSGHVTFDSDPATSWSGLAGQVTTDVSIPVLGHVYHSDITFTMDSDQRQIWGSGTFTEPITGDTTTMTISDSAPLVIKAADGTASAVPNACAYSLSGQVRLDVTGSDGTLTSYWNFTLGSASVAVNNATFTDTSGVTTALPDSSVTLICRSGGSIDDWVGTYDQFWACLPLEWGQARITTVVSAADTIAISDEDPPGSGDFNTYEAALLGANTHAVRGFFIAGPVGNQYREDFNWTLRKDGDGFSQTSRYQYFEGPNNGSGGICVARATRAP
jgi:hypothetical protein